MNLSDNSFISVCSSCDLVKDYSLDGAVQENWRQETEEDKGKVSSHGLCPKHLAEALRQIQKVKRSANERCL